MATEPPKIDYDRIDFPSDRLTMKQIRKRFYGYNSTQTFESWMEENGIGLAVMHYNEKLFADLGFARGTGDPERIREAKERLFRGWNDAGGAGPFVEPEIMKECIDSLALDYEGFGVADGPETAKQLIRNLEEQAAEQARQMLGRTGGAGS